MYVIKSAFTVTFLFPHNICRIKFERICHEHLNYVELWEQLHTPAPRGDHRFHTSLPIRHNFMKLMHMDQELVAVNPQ